jgi:hypothetical protein
VEGVPSNQAQPALTVPDKADVLSSEPGVVARISLEAVRYGYELGRCGGIDLASRLYHYNTAPLSPAVSRALPTPKALDELVSMSGPECMRPLIAEHWIPVTRWWQPGPWCSWAPRVASGPADLDPLVFKLYISPTWEYLGETARRCLPVLAEMGAPAFKWGRELAGVLRPDKFVVYFRDRDALSRAAERLLAVLGGLPVQGVPFTAEVGGAGLLSWAEDPLPTSGVTGVGSRLSWRQWVSCGLARSLATARPAPADGAEPWELALDQLRCYGVDPRSWTWSGPA